jgi:division protein CdvB (Snf7/Vps24/ESCRT-III family)
MADSTFYQQPGAEIAKAHARLESLTSRLQTAYARWQELESR